MLQIWNMKLLHLHGDSLISTVTTLFQYISSALILPVKTLSNSQKNTMKSDENTKVYHMQFSSGVTNRQYLFITLLRRHAVKNIDTF